MLVRAAVLGVLIALAGGLTARRARLLARLVRQGRPAHREGDLPTRLAREASHVLGQRKLFQRFVPGLMHALIFWGFLILLTTIVEVGGQVIDPAFEIPVIGGTEALGLIQDVFAGRRAPRLVPRRRRSVSVSAPSASSAATASRPTGSSASSSGSW